MIITISTQKGGVGKTTTAVNLGVLLARQHRRVLLTAGRAKAHTPGAHGAFPPCVHPPSRLVLAPHRSPACSVAVAADVCNPLRSPTRASRASRLSVLVGTTVNYAASKVEQYHRKTVGVMVVDDQPPFRRAARAVISATEGFEAIGDAESGPEALRDADRLQPDLVLVDVHMPEMDGFETARRLIESHPECVVVLVSLDALELPSSAVTTCGAVAFVRKQELRPATLRRLWFEHGARD